MIDQKTFFENYRIEPDVLGQAGLEWAELIRIAKDHVARTPELEIAARSMLGHLEKCSAVHSIRWRIKNFEHLLEKIIRKAKENPDRKITLANYKNEITDLIGVRVLHLFKSEWKAIHEDILKTWDLVEGHKPIAYIREGDEKQSYQECDCVVEVHKRDYRSVHYDISFHPTKELTVAEIQVRTIFEEGWSEIDHRIAYPNNADDPLLSGYLRIFNLLAGASDQMATYIGHLKHEFDQLKHDAREKDQEARDAIAALEKMQKELGKATKENKQLEDIVASLKRSAGNSAVTLGTLGNIVRSTSTASGSIVGFDPSTKVTIPSTGPFTVVATPNISPFAVNNPMFVQTELQKKCSKCGYVFPQGGILRITTCPMCGTSN